MSSMWYCCGCNFGPIDLDLHDSCTNCDQDLCSRCPRENSSDGHSNNNTGPSQEMSAYPCTPVLDAKSQHAVLRQVMAGTGPGELHSIPSLSRRTPIDPNALFKGVVQCYSQTYMWICCMCGDGPKVYNHQSKCVMCNHEACSSCQNVK
ncbi:Uncharacterized protein PECH_005882 [Penicillium ucsense]|uniref:Uncharacterized protein n=1 Tax=Penicillium ucsense TaxID=2839758 RepID=A0A8J8W8I2_9EURO|nr:Uncharacterized protein PECM_000704 [Penicillium ucsense]KAF7736069.1 Uncharacterized protein PECH_005882 [Penicillium ucsense]